MIYIVRKIKIKSLKYHIENIKLYFIITLILFFIIENKIILNLKVCVCTLAKLENKYIREFVQHYEKYGVDKIFLYDNNDIDGEEFQDVINDYMQKGFVEIKNWREKKNVLFEIMNDCYKRNYEKYDWLIFFEIDEFIHLYDYNNIKSFLHQTKFNKCQEIYLNLVCHTDNNLLYYEDKPLAERFPNKVPKTKYLGRILEMKSIIRGHNKKVHIIDNHLGDPFLKSCNSSGLHEHLHYQFTYNGDQKYYYIDHYYSKSTEEFIIKITKGDPLRNDSFYMYERINKYFEQSEITKEKIDLIEQRAHVNLDNFRKKLYKLL